MSQEPTAADVSPPRSAASSPSRPVPSPQSSSNELVRAVDAGEIARIFARAQRIAKANALRHERRKAKTMHADVKREFSKVNPAPDEARAAFAERMLKIQAADRIDTNLSRCNVPTIYRQAQVRDLGTVPEFARDRYAKAVAQVRDVIDRRPVIVALVGPRGPGKTTIACAFVIEACRADRSGRWLDAGDYFDFLKRTYGPGAKREEGDVENDWINPDLLAIDKLETAANTEWEDRKLQRLIVKRYELGRRTILVSNDTAAALSTRLGESVVDRMRDGGLMVTCKWPSLRGAAE